MANLLVFYSTIEGHTARIAERIAQRLETGGHAVELQRFDAAGAEFSRYAGVVVGASIHYGHHPRALGRLLKERRASLEGRTSAFFSVSLTASEHYAEKFLRQTGWRPQLSATFAGALQYSKYGPVKRLVIRGFAAMGGHDTDPSRDYEYTDWDAVERFATAFSRRLA